MNKEELTALGLTEVQIAEVFKINGKDVEKSKSEVTAKEAEIATVKEHLKTANTEIQSYKSMNIEEIKKAADDYKAKFEEAETKSKKEMEALKFNFAVENALMGANAKNTKAAKALLNLEGLKLNGEEVVGLKEQLDTIKKEHDYLFGVTTPAGTGGSKGAGSKLPSDPAVVNYGSQLGKTSKVEKVDISKYEL